MNARIRTGIVCWAVLWVHCPKRRSSALSNVFWKKGIRWWKWIQSIPHWSTCGRSSRSMLHLIICALCDKRGQNKRTISNHWITSSWKTFSTCQQMSRHFVLENVQSGAVKYRLRGTDEWQHLSVRTNRASGVIEPVKLYASQLKISIQKFKHLQEMKPLVSWLSCFLWHSATRPKAEALRSWSRVTVPRLSFALICIAQSRSGNRMCLKLIRLFFQSEWRCCSCKPFKYLNVF